MIVKNNKTGCKMKRITLIAAVLISLASCKKEELKRKDYEVTYRKVCDGVEQWRDTYTVNDSKERINNLHSPESTTSTYNTTTSSGVCHEEIVSITEIK